MTDGTPEAMAAARKVLQQLEGDGSGREKVVSSKSAEWDEDNNNTGKAAPIKEREGESL